ncbi:MAG: type I restriction enzyme HsdR N-terminal domain-containing protein [Bacteroidales bacterium]|nr:type I restriction enzyme HsdR N-terminal domain-containing protein [Bacteroidales bacterium]
MNKNFWNMYKDSEKGKKAIDLFNPEPEKLAESIEKLGEYAQNELNDENSPHYMYYDIWANFEEEEEFNKKLQTNTRESFSEFIDMFYVKEADFSDENEIKFTGRIILPQQEYRWMANSIDSISFYLYYNYDFFKPIFNKLRFDIIRRNCDAIGLRLPPIPRSNDYKEYLMYYYDVCVAFNNFQKKNKLTDAEFCACLYDYAPMYIKEESLSELPKPTNVWITGAAPGDFDILDNLGKGDNSGNPTLVWACNERTKRGDIVIIYCRTPRSCIHSIWRAKNDGIFNPFDYYHCRVNVCEGIRVPPITSKELKADPYFSQVPIVRKNLQGIKGVEFTAEDYSELLRFIAQKGGDVSALPKLFEAGNYNFGEVKIEKDVEEKILIPMLEKLGYSSDDWTRQLSLKAGRNQKAIPDFVFFAKGERHFENAPFIIEAKYDMAYITDQQNAFTQALSYARMLRSKLMGICDKNRIILYNVNDDGSCNRNQPIYENHWETIYSDELEGARLKKLIGRDVVKNI